VVSEVIITVFSINLKHIQTISAIVNLYIPGILAGQWAGAVNCTQETGMDGNGYEASETPFETAGAPPDAML
jgi:hypothetical protein